MRHPFLVFGNDKEPRQINLFCFLVAPPKSRATKKWSIDSLSCSPTRKSLVKGERFIRVEGKPELTVRLKLGAMQNVMRQDMWDTWALVCASVFGTMCKFLRGSFHNAS